jgi:hypothetical protein
LKRRKRDEYRQRADALLGISTKPPAQPQQSVADASTPA